MLCCGTLRKRIEHKYSCSSPHIRCPSFDSHLRSIQQLISPIMLLSIISNTLPILLFFPLLCYSATDPNPFASDEYEPEIFYGLPGSDGYKAMGAPPAPRADNPSYMVANAPSVADSAPGEESDTGGMSAFAASGSSSPSPQEFYCPQDNNAKFST